MNKAGIARINVEDFAKMSPEERRKAVQGNTIKPPKLGTPDRKRFDELLFGNEPAAAAAPAEPQPPIPPKGDEPPATPPADQQPPAPPAGQDPPKGQYGGFDTLEELLEDNRKAKEQTSRLEALVKEQGEIMRRINATASNEGRTVKKLKEELESNKAMIEGLQKKISEPPAQHDELGEPPDPMNDQAYPEGVLDTNYHKDMALYSKKVAAHVAAVNKRNCELESKVNSLEQGHQKVARAVSSREQADAEAAGRAMEDAFLSDVHSFQDQYGLKMSRSFEDINKAILTRNNPQATDDEKRQANAVMSSLRPEDGPMFDKVARAINTRYRFEDGRPISLYRTWKAAIADNDLDGDYQVASNQPPAPPRDEGKARLTEAQRKQHDAAVDAIPASRAASDTPIHQQKNSKQDRLMELNRIREQNPASFRKSGMWDEYVKLRSELGVQIPQRA